jgi:hypothetical protein
MPLLGVHFNNKVNAGCGGAYLQSQYFIGKGRRIASLRTTWATGDLVLNNKKSNQTT